MHSQEDKQFSHTKLLSYKQFKAPSPFASASNVRLIPLSEGLSQERDTSSLFPGYADVQTRTPASVQTEALAGVQTKAPAHAPTTEQLPIAPKAKRFSVPEISLSGFSLSGFSLPGFSKGFRRGESFSGLHKHWMSVRQQHIYLSVVFFAVGFSAITALAIAAIGVLPLDVAAYVLIWPSMVTWLVLGILYPNYGKLALKGFIIGMLACFFYDIMRFVTIALGLWGDFIPKIGMMLLHTNKPDWVVGYIWRYVGDGGFMSVTFVVGYHLLKPKLDVRIAALGFGLVIWVCLIGTVLLAPQGAFFALTPVTFTLSLLGHVIYGLSIGILYRILIDKKIPGWFPIGPNVSKHAANIFKHILAPQNP